MQKCQTNENVSSFYFSLRKLINFQIKKLILAGFKNTKHDDMYNCVSF